MTGIASWLGEADPGVLNAMLGAIDCRGDAVDTCHAPGIALGYRWWHDRQGKSPGVHRSARHVAVCAGTRATAVTSPPAHLVDHMGNGNGTQRRAVLEQRLRFHRLETYALPSRKAGRFALGLHTQAAYTYCWRRLKQVDCSIGAHT